MVEATLRSVARHGLKETTLASFSREAGLNQGVAVFCFESKDRLLAAAFTSSIGGTGSPRWPRRGRTPGGSSPR